MDNRPKFFEYNEYGDLFNINSIIRITTTVGKTIYHYRLLDGIEVEVSPKRHEFLMKYIADPVNNSIYYKEEKTHGT